MSGLKIFLEIVYIIAGLATIIFVFVLEMEPYYALFGVGLIAWAIYDIHKETRDRSKKGEVARLSKEREEIMEKLKKK